MKAQRVRSFSPILALAACVGGAALARADSPAHSDFLTGPLGLNTVPNARMNETGTIKTGISSSDPYLHGYIGIQIAEPLYIQLRQSAETSNIWAEPDAFYPGIDIKLRLAEETRWRPAIAVGMQSAIGERRMGGEYLTFSKRYKAFDFTTGMGWGRYGSSAHIGNPFALLGGDYNDTRDLTSSNTHEPSDWFTGKKIGFFGGLEYFTPLEGLSLKADWGADRYLAERAAGISDAPAPWSVGVNYAPKPWTNFSVGIQGTDTLMGRFTIQSNFREYPRPKRQEALALNKDRKASDPASLRETASDDRTYLSPLEPETPHESAAALWLSPEDHMPPQLGRAAVHMANHAPADVESLEIKPRLMGLSGPNITLLRRDLERLHDNQKGSTAELWRSARIKDDDGWRSPGENNGGEIFAGGFDYSLTQENIVSLSEEHSGILGRSAIIAEGRSPSFFGLLNIDAGIRYNFASNLEGLNYYRPISDNPVRSDVDLFAARGLALEKLSATITHSPRSDTHLALSGGYLEEMYAGYGGELLYRPYKKRYALGLEGWQAYKRDPYSTLNHDLTGNSIFSGHINAWYDLPLWDLTLKGQFGRYLRGDTGGSLGLHKYFSNGVKLESFATVTDEHDYDVYGGRSHAFYGVGISLPLGNLPYMPRNTRMVTRAEALGRDSGQAIRKPYDLYELTNQFSYKNIGETWTQIAPEKNNTAQKK